MAVSSNAMTLAQYLLIAKDPVARAVTFALIKGGNVLADIPFVDRNSFAVQGLRITGAAGELPNSSWVTLNAEGVNTIGQPTPFSEQGALMRNYIDIDHLFLQEINQLVDPRALQTQAFIESFTLDYNSKFVLNNHNSGDANAPVGLRFRLDNPTDWGLRSSNKLDAGGAVFTTAMTAAQANSFLEILDTLLWQLNSPNGDGVVLYMNEVLMRRFHFALRLLGTSGGMRIDRDQFDRVITYYKGARLQDIGYKVDQTSRIITTTETAAGLDGSSTFTSIYGVNYGLDNFFGWQFAPMVIKRIGMLENGVIYRLMAEWFGGFVSQSNKSIARLYDIKIS